MQVEESGFLNLLCTTTRDSFLLSSVAQCGDQSMWLWMPLRIRVCRTFILEILMGCGNVLIPPETDDYTYK